MQNTTPFSISISIPPSYLFYNIFQDLISKVQDQSTNLALYLGLALASNPTFLF